MRLQSLPKAKFLDLSQENKLSLIIKVRFRRRQKKSKSKETKLEGSISRNSLDLFLAKLSLEQKNQISQFLSSCSVQKGKERTTKGINAFIRTLDREK